MIAPRTTAARPAIPRSPDECGQPTQTATPEPVDGDPSDDVTREMMFAIGGGLLVLFLGIGCWISRDARRNLPADERDDPRRLREEARTSTSAGRKLRRARRAAPSGRPARARRRR